MARGVGLDRGRVVEAAAALADAEGPDALTLARLADQLGVRSPSLFKHVAGLDDLRAAVTSRAWVGLVDVLEGQDDLVGVGVAWWRWARAHPGVYGVAARVPAARLNEDPAAAEALRRVLAICAVHTGPGEPALHAARGVRALVHGFVLLEAGGGFGIPTGVEASFERSLRALVAGLGAPDRP